jgi:hypothetical protein
MVAAVHFAVLTHHVQAQRCRCLELMIDVAGDSAI